MLGSQYPPLVKQIHTWGKMRFKEIARLLKSAMDDPEAHMLGLKNIVIVDPDKGKAAANIIFRLKKAESISPISPSTQVALMAQALSILGLPSDYRFSNSGVKLADTK